MFIPVLFQVNGVDSGCCYGGSAGQRIDSRVDPLVVFGRFHFHFFERQHNNYRQLSANDCNEEIINTFSNKTKQTSKKHHYNYY